MQRAILGRSWPQNRPPREAASEPSARPVRRLPGLRPAPKPWGCATPSRRSRQAPLLADHCSRQAIKPGKPPILPSHRTCQAVGPIKHRVARATGPIKPPGLSSHQAIKPSSHQACQHPARHAAAPTTLPTRGATPPGLPRHPASRSIDAQTGTGAATGLEHAGLAAFETYSANPPQPIRTGGRPPVWSAGRRRRCDFSARIPPLSRFSSWFWHGWRSSPSPPAIRRKSRKRGGSPPSR